MNLLADLKMNREKTKGLGDNKRIYDRKYSRYESFFCLFLSISASFYERRYYFFWLLSCNFGRMTL